ncbi:hypothetical protein BH20ACT2_BH20ACT2_07390 [soil metagenome]
MPLRPLAATLAGLCCVLVLAAGCDGSAPSAPSPGSPVDTGDPDAPEFGVDGQRRAHVTRLLVEHHHLLGAAGRAALRGTPDEALVHALAATTDELAATLVPPLDGRTAERFRSAWASDSAYLLASVRGPDAATVADSGELARRCDATAAAAELDGISTRGLATTLCRGHQALLRAVAARPSALDLATGLLVGAGPDTARSAALLTPPVSAAGDLLVDLTALLTEHVVLVGLRAELTGAGEEVAGADQALERNAAALHRRLRVAVGGGDDFRRHWDRLVAGYRSAAVDRPAAADTARADLAVYLRRVLAGRTAEEVVAGLWRQGDRLVAAANAAHDARTVAPALQRAALTEAEDAAAFLAGALSAQYPDEFD